MTGWRGARRTMAPQARPGGFPQGRGDQGALLGNNPGQHAAHLAWTERTARIHPGQPLRLGLRAGQLDLIMDGGDHICPAFHLLRQGS